MVDLDQFYSSAAGRKVWGYLKNGRLRPYPTRSEIEDGALAGQKLEFLWIDDPVDVFFTQVQGSGRVELDTGQTISVGFAGKNGRKYTAIGRVLVERGEMTKEQASMQSIRAWMVDHPDQAGDLMRENDGFVFFAEQKGHGAVGSQGVVLTPERSVAVDRAWIPMSMLMWFDIEVPVAGKVGEVEPLRRMMIAQDTGGAIKGAVRADVFWGGSKRAADIAGRMNSSGSYYLLLPNAIAERQ